CAGDVNINMLEIAQNYPNNFNKLLEELDLQQLIAEPTRITSNSSSLIDVIVCSNTLHVTDSGVQYSCDLPTDHEVVFCSFKEIKRKVVPQFRTYRDYKHLDLDNFDRDLNNLPFDTLFYIKNIDEKIQYF